MGLPTDWMARLRAERDVALAMLRQLEWSALQLWTGVGSIRPAMAACPSCWRAKPDHAPDCALAAFLARPAGAATTGPEKGGE